MDKEKDKNVDNPPATQSPAPLSPAPVIPAAGVEPAAGVGDVASTGNPDITEKDSMDVDQEEGDHAPAPPPVPMTPKDFWILQASKIAEVITKDNAIFKARTAEQAQKQDAVFQGGSMRFTQTASAIGGGFYQRKAAANRPKGQMAWQDAISFGLVPKDAFNIDVKARDHATEELRLLFNKSKNDFPELENLKLVNYGDNLTLHKAKFDHSPKEGYRSDVNNGWDYLDPCHVSSENEHVLGHVASMLNKMAEVNDFPFDVIRRSTNPNVNIRTTLFYLYIPDYMDINVADDLEKHHLNAILNEFQTQINQFSPGAKVDRNVRLIRPGDIPVSPKASYQIKVAMHDNLPAEMCDFKLVLDPTKDHYSGLQVVKVHFADGHGCCVKCKSTKHERDVCPHERYKRPGEKMKIPQVFVPICKIGSIPVTPRLDSPSKPGAPGSPTTATPKPAAGTNSTTARVTPVGDGYETQRRSKRHPSDRDSTAPPSPTPQGNTSNYFSALSADETENHVVDDGPTSTPTKPPVFTPVVPPVTPKKVQSKHQSVTTPSRRLSSSAVDSPRLRRGSRSRNSGPGKRGLATTETFAPEDTLNDTPLQGEKRGRAYSSPPAPHSSGERHRDEESPSKRRISDESPEKSGEGSTRVPLGAGILRLWNRGDSSRVIVSTSRNDAGGTKFFDLPASEARKVCAGSIPIGLKGIPFHVFHKGDELTTDSLTGVPPNEQLDKVCETLEELETHLSKTPFEPADAALQARPAELQ